MHRLHNWIEVVAFLFFGTPVQSQSISLVAGGGSDDGRPPTGGLSHWYGPGFFRQTLDSQFW